MSVAKARRRVERAKPLARVDGTRSSAPDAMPDMGPGPGDDDDDDDEVPIGDPPDDDDADDWDEDDDDDDEEPLQAQCLDRRRAILHRSIASVRTSRHNVARSRGHGEPHVRSVTCYLNSDL
jgi:hypothetical protein